MDGGHDAAERLTSSETNTRSHRPDGNVSATSPASHKAFHSSGSTARVSSKCSTKSNCSGNRAWK